MSRWSWTQTPTVRRLPRAALTLLVVAAIPLLSGCRLALAALDVTVDVTADAVNATMDVSGEAVDGALGVMGMRQEPQYEEWYTEEHVILRPTRNYAEKHPEQEPDWSGPEQQEGSEPPSDYEGGHAEPAPRLPPVSPGGPPPDLGKVRPSRYPLAFLGVRFRAPSDAWRSSGDPDGVPIEGVVRGSAAASAGLKPGDLIVSLGGIKVHSAEDLMLAVRVRDVGEKVKLTYVRNGVLHTVSIRLGVRSRPT